MMNAQPKAIGRQFVACYYNIMNKSPDNLHCLYTDDANFSHDVIAPTKDSKPIEVIGKKAIHEVMVNRMETFKHSCTRVDTVETYESLEDSLIIQLLGNISFDDSDYRSFSQSFILVPKTPFKYFVQNDIFRFNDVIESTASQCSEFVFLQSQYLDDEHENCEETSFDATEPNDFDENSMPNEQVVPVSNDINEELEHENVCDDQMVDYDLEKSIMDIQSINLKNVLLEPRTITKENIMKRVPTPPTIDQSTNEMVENSETEIISQKQCQLFRDKCILTIGNVINPNIEFDDQTEETFEEKHDVCEGEKADEDEDLMLKKKKINNRRRRDKKQKARKISKNAQQNESIMQDSSPPNSETRKSWASENESSDENRTPMQNYSKPNKNLEEQTIEPPSNDEKPKTFADLVKKERTGQNDEWQDDWKNDDRRGSDTFNRSSKLRSSLPRNRGRQEKRSPRDSNQSNRSSSNGDLLQVFAGNIPHEADEEEIRTMFGRFGRIKRFRMHTNPRINRAKRYAFIVYESIQSVRNCLAKRNSFYWPENLNSGQKLNVNGDDSLMVDFATSPTTPQYNESTTRKKSVKSIGTDTADLYPRSDRSLKKFHKNFVLTDSKDTAKKESSNTNANIADVVSAVKNERNINRSDSTRA